MKRCRRYSLAPRAGQPTRIVKIGVPIPPQPWTTMEKVRVGCVFGGIGILTVCLILRALN